MIDVVELFAGVGGFRVGLERQGDFNVIWGNQWEPSKKVQYAFDCYSERFKGRGIHSNQDISKAKKEVPTHDLLVGGFPCQDYSVARSLAGESGIQGKKGVLFWEIMDIVNIRKPMFVLLENVDRLLKSPAKQRGRDFAIMLASFRNAGYYVEWRVLNAADYGFAQKRRRIFIFAYRENTNFASGLKNSSYQEIIHERGFFASEFPIRETSTKHPVTTPEKLPTDLVFISDEFKATFRNSGIMKDGIFYTEEIVPERKPPKKLGQVIEEARKYQIADEKYYLNEKEVGKNGKTTLEMFEYLKGAKKVERTSNTGHVYTYSEGGMNFPDDLDSPARTMLTSEGSKNRSTHVVRDPYTKKLRILTPVECELLNDFPPNWTQGMPDKARYFCMGNALVVGLIEKMGKKIKELYVNEVTTVEAKYIAKITEMEKQIAELTFELQSLKSKNHFSSENFYEKDQSDKKVHRKVKRKGTVRGSNIKKKLNKKTRFTINRKVRRQGKIRRLPINNSTSHGTVKIGARRMKNITQHKKINKKTPVIVYREKVAL